MILLGLTTVCTLGLTSCLKTPGTPELTASKTSVAVNEPVTITMKSIENYTCIQWTTSSTGPTTVSGGGEQDLTWSVKFSSPGSKTISANAKNCKNGCIGTCKSSSAELTLTVN